MARDEELDLVEIAPNAQPPVAKIIDFKKFLYLEERKEKEARKHTKETELKEVRFSPFIGEHDLEVGVARVRKFLKEGDLVKITVVFKGRQMTHTEFGPKVLKRVMDHLQDEAVQDRVERMEGKRFVTVLRAAKSQPKKTTEEIGNINTNIKTDEKNETKDEKISSQKI